MNTLEHQNRVIIALLARNVLGLDYISKIVKGGKKKGNPEDYVQAYNALDGLKSGMALAKKVGVSQQAMSKVLQTWEEKGIAYRVGTNYVGLLKLPQENDRQTISKVKKVRKH